MGSNCSPVRSGPAHWFQIVTKLKSKMSLDWFEQDIFERTAKEVLIIALKERGPHLYKMELVSPRIAASVYCETMAARTLPAAHQGLR